MIHTCTNKLLQNAGYYIVIHGSPQTENKDRKVLSVHLRTPSWLEHPGHNTHTQTNIYDDCLPGVFYFRRWGKHTPTSTLGCLASACSLHLTSLVVHMKVCMHVLHCMVMAFLFVSSWLPFAACFAFSAFLSLAVFDFCAFPPPMFDLKDSYTIPWTSRPCFQTAQLPLLATPVPRLPHKIFLLLLLLLLSPDFSTWLPSLFDYPAKPFHSQSNPTPLSFSNRTHCETPPPLATLLISTSNTAAHALHIPSLRFLLPHTQSILKITPSKPEKGGKKQENKKTSLIPYHLIWSHLENNKATKSSIAAPKTHVSATTTTTTSISLSPPPPPSLPQPFHHQFSYLKRSNPAQMKLLLFT